MMTDIRPCYNAAGLACQTISTVDWTGLLYLHLQHHRNKDYRSCPELLEATDRIGTRNADYRNDSPLNIKE